MSLISVLNVSAFRLLLQTPVALHLSQLVSQLLLISSLTVHHSNAQPIAELKLSSALHVVSQLAIVHVHVVDDSSCRLSPDYLHPRGVFSQIWRLHLTGCGLLPLLSGLSFKRR